MKKTALITMLLSLVGATGAFAVGGMTFGVDGGLAMPSNSYTPDFKLGFQGGVFGDRRTKRLGTVGIRIDYVRLTPKDDLIAYLEQFASGKAGTDVKVDVKESNIPITLYAKIGPPMKGSMAPYAVVGFGYYFMRHKEKLTILGLSGEESVNTNEFGTFFGIGVDFKASSRTRAGVFAKYHLIPGVPSPTTASGYFNMGVSVSFAPATK